MHFVPIPGTYADPTDLTLPEGDTYNLWQGFGFRPKEGDCGMLKSHIREVWCAGDERKFEYVLDWLAAVIQHPEKVGLPQLVLYSKDEGTGKNIVIENFLLPLFGSHGAVVDKPDQLTGRFNALFAQAVFVYVNEAVWGGDKQREGAYKTIFSDRTRTLERKFVDPVIVPNYAKGIAATNNEFFAPAGMSDRRHVVLEVASTRRGDGVYFAALYEHITRGGGREALLHELLQRKVDFDALRVPPNWRSVARQMNLVRGLPPIDQFLFEWFEGGSYYLDRGDRKGWPHTMQPEQLQGASSEFPVYPVSTERNDKEKTWWLENGPRYCKQYVFEAYQHYCKAAGHFHSGGASTFWGHIKQRYPDLVTEYRSGSNPRGIEFPPLLEAREIFAKACSFELQWSPPSAYVVLGGGAAGSAQAAATLEAVNDPYPTPSEAEAA